MEYDGYNTGEGRLGECSEVTSPNEMRNRLYE